MREISQLHLPIRRPEDVIPYLGSPGHWRDGRSAKLIAESWFAWAICGNVGAREGRCALAMLTGQTGRVEPPQSS